MNSKISTEKYLSYFGISVKQALDFIITNLNSPSTIFEAAKKFRLTTNDLLQIARQDFPDLTFHEVAKYFSDSGLNSEKLDVPSVRDIQQLMNYQYWNHEKFYDYKGAITTNEVYKGGYDLIAMGDLNNDGKMELVIGFMTWNDVWDKYPIENQFAMKKVLIATLKQTNS
jgi:hypothetical protein